MKVFFATWPEEESQGDSLTDRKAFNRLMSYYFILKIEDHASMLAEYTSTGILKRKKKHDAIS